MSTPLTFVVSPRGVSRRLFVRLMALSSAGALLGACAPAAPASPTAAPAAAKKPPAAPSPAAAAPTAAAPATSPSPKPAAAPSPSPAAAKPAASPAEWDRVVTAARQEGVVAVGGGPGESYRTALTAFEKAYPGISVEYTGASGRDFAPKILAERDAGRFLWDIHVGGAETPNLQLKPKGVLDPVTPALMLPEVLDESKWLGGFKPGFMDNEGQYIYAGGGFLFGNVLVNRDVVPEGELSKIEQLLDPKWKGKITWDNPGAAGGGSGDAGHLLMVLGQDFLKRLYENGVVVTTDRRQQAEWLVRGSHPIALGIERSQLTAFRRQGVGLSVQWLDPDSEAGVRLRPGFNNVMLVNRAPHPNAARVYLNWLLSKNGQTAWVAEIGENSRRLDVDGPKETAPDPKKSYRIVNSEAYNQFITTAQELARQTFK